MYKLPKVLALLESKQVGAMRNSARETNFTMIDAINAGGGFIPPMLIFSRIHFKDFMLAGALPGWSNEELFLQFFDNFLEHVKPSNENPCILLMDKHESNISMKLT